MAHIPPKRSPLSEEPKPITIRGEAKTITITLPPFFAVNTSMSIKLSKDGGAVALVHSEVAHEHHEHEEEISAGRTFESRITCIELENVQSGEPGKPGVLVFKPTAGGECTINIFFDHLQ